VAPGNALTESAGHDSVPSSAGPDSLAARQDQPNPAIDGPFTPRQLFRIDDALRAADRETSLVFSVYVGELDEPIRDHAEQLLDALEEPARSVLLAVSPNQRVLEIVTGEQAVRRLPDRVCALAALSMTAAFGGGDLAGGVVTGLRMLADQAR
jgi:hypothetical protein